MREHVAAVLFDFGGVILTSPFEAFAAYERRRGVPRDSSDSINSTNPDDNAWARLERPRSASMSSWPFEAEARTAFGSTGMRCSGASG